MAGVFLHPEVFRTIERKKLYKFNLKYSFLNFLYSIFYFRCINMHKDFKMTKNTEGGDKEDHSNI